MDETDLLASAGGRLAVLFGESGEWGASGEFAQLDEPFGAGGVHLRWRGHGYHPCGFGTCAQQPDGKDEVLASRPFVVDDYGLLPRHLDVNGLPVTVHLG